MGIVGMPNIGKSSLFNILTSSSVPALNYPFCTIDPSEARVQVPDHRFDWLVKHVNPNSVVPAFLTVMDIAGLVRGAAKGEGLGNAFLANIKATDGIFHLVRAFKDQGIVHVENSVDPVRDAEIIDLELRLKDADQISALLTKTEGKSSKGAAAVDTKLLEHVQHLLATTTRPLTLEPWTADEARALAQLRLLSLKPLVHLVNMSEEDYLGSLNGATEPEYITKLKERMRGGIDGATDPLVVGYSGTIEGLLADMGGAEEREEVVEDLKQSYGVKVVKSAIDDIVHAGYKAVGLNHYFTYGKVEVRAWTVRQGTKAPQAAAVIHSDFEKNFIAAEVMRFEDLQALGSEEAVRAAGKYYTRGKDAVIGDGDIVSFKIGKKKA
ncbi:putative GTP binding protein [Rhizoclosmatium globosum]|uniref:Putative GTP binding protein n=1 Tax=Rhizoclosmatium globosum TaxID=329046 RepID=A0A1Y2CLH7_9FUNG|nr:putative GTP binding protein [Rhizoclosmatium globosum]|eukprot:ORY47888.1 putative GTP binding protein [Rhizoclosmatium globosum]